MISETINDFIFITRIKLGKTLKFNSLNFPFGSTNSIQFGVFIMWIQLKSIKNVCMCFVLELIRKKKKCYLGGWEKNTIQAKIWLVRWMKNDTISNRKEWRGKKLVVNCANWRSNETMVIIEWRSSFIYYIYRLSHFHT